MTGKIRLGFGEFIYETEGEVRGQPATRRECCQTGEGIVSVKYLCACGDYHPKFAGIWDAEGRHFPKLA